jgi:hypothetical protein
MNFTNPESYEKSIPTIEQGNITVDFLLHEIIILNIQMGISHSDQVVSRKTKQDYRKKV